MQTLICTSNRKIVNILLGVISDSACSSHVTVCYRTVWTEMEVLMEYLVNLCIFNKLITLMIFMPSNKKQCPKVWIELVIIISIVAYVQRNGKSLNQQQILSIILTTTLSEFTIWDYLRRSLFSHLQLWRLWLTSQFDLENFNCVRYMVSNFIDLSY